MILMGSFLLNGKVFPTSFFPGIFTSFSSDLERTKAVLFSLLLVTAPRGVRQWQRRLVPIGKASPLVSPHLFPNKRSPPPRFCRQF